MPPHLLGTLAACLGDADFMGCTFCLAGFVFCSITKRKREEPSLPQCTLEQAEMCRSTGQQEVISWQEGV